MYLQAIDLILEPPNATIGFQKDMDLTIGRKVWIATKDAGKALSKIKRSINTVEAQLLLSLKERGKDLVGALNTVRRFLLTSSMTHHNYRIVFEGSSQLEIDLHPRLSELPMEHCYFETNGDIWIRTCYW